MKRTDLKPNQTVAVKGYLKNYYPARIVDTGHWSESLVSRQADVRVLEDGNEYDVREFTLLGNRQQVLVEVNNGLGYGPDKRLEVISLSLILGDYEAVDAERTAQRDARTAALAAERRRLDEARAVDAVAAPALRARFTAAGIKAHVYGGQVTMSYAEVEALLEKAGA